MTNTLRVGDDGAVSAGQRRILAEYHEMPGLRLTSEQVARLCGLDRGACAAVLAALVDCGYLEHRPDGRYARPVDPRRPRYGAAALPSEPSGLTWTRKRA